MTSVLAIDPGAETCACVTFAEGVLVHADFTIETSGPLREVVVERMQADERTRHVDVRHVLACQFMGALCAGLAAGRTGAVVTWYTPTEWKGTEPKPLQHARLWEVLTDTERVVLGGGATLRAINAAVEKGALRRWKISGAECYPRSFKGHNLLDAASLGCVHLGRLERR